jgi:hypothetical protein
MMSGYIAAGSKCLFHSLQLRGRCFARDLVAGLARGIHTVTHGHLNMVSLLSLLSFIAVAAGVFVLGLGVPVRETWFGAALLMAGSVAVTGGFILVGLAAAVHELRQVGQGFKAPPSGMPRPVRPLERQDEERLDGVDRRMASRMRMPVALGADARDMISAKFDAPDTRERWRKSGPEEWLLRAMAEIESASRHTDAAPAPIDYHSGETRRPSNSWPRPAITLPPDHADTEMRRTSAVSSHDVFSKEIFETIWSSGHRSREEGLEQRTEPLPEAGKRSAESKSPPLSPAQPAASASTKPVHVEPRPLPILKTGVIQQMAYTLFTDGSIETQMPEGIRRFASLEEFLGHLQKRDG